MAVTRGRLMGATAWHGHEGNPAAAPAQAPAAGILPSSFGASAPATAPRQTHPR